MNKLGTYIQIWHGRENRDDTLNDWGSVGPVFGPFEDVQITYGSHIHGWPKPDSGVPKLELTFDGDMIVHEGVYYGDMSIFAGYVNEQGKGCRV